MVIEGARIATSSATTAYMNLWIHNEQVSFRPIASARDLALKLEGCLILPGLINAHDHLELNLFPKLGHGPYANASDWARDVYHPNETPIKEHLAVPKALRLTWGAIKNLISGVTTVAHHNDFHSEFLKPFFPVRVIRRYGWAHSLAFSPDWKVRFENTPANVPFVMHAAEGTDAAAQCEIRTLANAGVLNRSTILVHAVAATPSALHLLRQAGTGIVWCPTSNYFTLSRSLGPFVFHSEIPIALGSDSAMTADGDLLDELRFASRSMDAHRLYRMVTSEPAQMFKLPRGFGRISDGGPADLVVMKDRGRTPAMTLLSSYPEMVIVRGRIHLVSSALAQHCPPSTLESLQRVDVEGRGTYLVAGRVKSMLDRTTQTLQGEARLAGKAIAA